MIEKNILAGLYLRISNDDERVGESVSIENQKILLSKHAHKCGWEIKKIYIDDGYSGINFERPAFRQMISDAKDKHINLIAVKDLSRFGRNLIEAGNYLEQIFPEWGVRFVSVNDMYDSAAFKGATGGTDIAFRNFIAQMYSQDLSEKVRSAKDSATCSGKIISTYPLYGYDKDKNDHHKLVIDTDTAHIVKKIFDLAEQGVSMAETVRILNAENVPTKQYTMRQKGYMTKCRDGNCWVSYAVSKILHDERYTGKWIYGVTRLPYVGAARAVRVPKSEWIIINGAIPAIISEEQYWRVQEILEGFSKKKSKTNPENKSIFKGKMKCGECRKAMRYNTRKNGVKVFFCGMHLLSAEYDCNTGKIDEGLIYDIILKTIQFQVALNDLASAKVKGKADKLLSNTEAISTKMRTLQLSIEKAKVAKISVWESHHSGETSLEAFQSENKKLTSQITEHEKAIETLKAKAKKLEPEAEYKNKLAEQFSKQFCIRQLTKEIVDTFVKAIIIYSANRIEIILNYSKNTKTKNFKDKDL